MKFVTFDPINGDLALHLPESHQSYQTELYTRLVERFLSLEMNDATLEAMNRFVVDWLQQNGEPQS